MTYYHGGKPGLRVGELLVPSSPHVTDGCPVCVARAEGRGYTVGEYRAWIAQFEGGQQMLDNLADLPADHVIDPPTDQAAVYFTTDIDYARWYAARSGHGDLYEVEPEGETRHATGDHFTSYNAPAARVVRIIERGVWLKRRERRELMRRWKKADEAHLKARA